MARILNIDDTITRLDEMLEKYRDALISARYSPDAIEHDETIERAGHLRYQICAFVRKEIGG